MYNEQWKQDIEARLVKMQAEIADLSGQFYKNNLSSTQVFNKDSIFNARLKLPHYSSAPAIGEVGDMIEVGGKAYICTTASVGGSGAVFTLIGSQT